MWWHSWLAVRWLAFWEGFCSMVVISYICIPITIQWKAVRFTSFLYTLFRLYWTRSNSRHFSSSRFISSLLAAVTQSSPRCASKRFTSLFCHESWSAIFNITESSLACESSSGIDFDFFWQKNKIKTAINPLMNAHFQGSQVQILPTF